MQMVRPAVVGFFRRPLGGATFLPSFSPLCALYNYVLLTLCRYIFTDKGAVPQCRAVFFSSKFSYEKNNRSLSCEIVNLTVLPKTNFAIEISILDITNNIFVLGTSQFIVRYIAFATHKFHDVDVMFIVKF